MYHDYYSVRPRGWVRGEVEPKVISQSIDEELVLDGWREIMSMRYPEVTCHYMVPDHE